MAFNNESVISVRIDEDDAIRGRPQSVVRSWFMEIGQDDSITKVGDKRSLIKTIKGYVCPYCKKLIDCTEISYLKRHVLSCTFFDGNKKGICTCFCYIYIKIHLRVAYYQHRINGIITNINTCRRYSV